METSTPPVAAGALSGVNLSGDPESAKLPDDPPKLAGDEQPQEAPEKSANGVAPAKAEQAAQAAQDAPQPEKKGAPARTYVVLEENEFEEGGTFYTEVHRVDARNAQNAMRRAFKDLHADTEAARTLVVVPLTMWKPTRVRLAKTERVSVSFS